MKTPLKKIAKALVPEAIWNGARKLRTLLFGKCERSFEFEVQLADHCNLNCAGCNHFSPVAALDEGGGDENFLNVETYEKDYKRLSELAGGYVSAIRLMGGEPLLHSQINGVVKITRTNFPDCEIKIVTNGILLDRQDAEFWDCCHANNIIVSITPYPVNLNLRKIYELSIKHDVKVVYFCGSFKIKFRKEYFDPEGRQNIKESFLKCYKCCHQLRDGRLYMCPPAAYIKYINRFFSTNFEVTPADYIDIYQTKGIKEILGYLNQPIPFCRYCDMGKNDLINWQISKKEISEWT